MSQVSTADIDQAFSAPVAPETVETTGKELARMVERPINKHVPFNAAGQLAPQDFAGCCLVAKFLADNDLLPEAYWGNERNRRSPAQAVGVAIAAIIQGRKHGMDPMESIRWHLPIRNSLALWGDAVPGVVRNKLRALGERVNEAVTYAGEGDKRSCSVVVVHKDKAGTEIGTISRSFSMADAARANLTGKGPWKSSPDRMLMHRARTYAYRDLFPDLMMGLPVAEEEQDVAVEVESRRRVSLDETLAAAKTGETPPQ